MQSVIKIQDLIVGYGNKNILTPFSVSVDVGELICIIGRNGQGKSTIIKTLCKLLPPLSGKITVNEKQLTELSNKEFSSLISVVLTSKISIQNTTVFEFVAFGRYPFTNWLGTLTNNDHEIIMSAIELCGIFHLKDRDFNSLSDGEKQKANIARAIAQQTPIVIFDEPTAHLDLVNNIEIVLLLKKLSKNHQKTILFSTHHIELAIQSADKIWVVTQGEFYEDIPAKLIEKGIIAKIFENTSIHYNAKQNTFSIV